MNEYRFHQIILDSRKLIYKGTALNYKVYNLTEDAHSFEVTAYINRFLFNSPTQSVNDLQILVIILKHRFLSRNIVFCGRRKTGELQNQLKKEYPIYTDRVFHFNQPFMSILPPICGCTEFSIAFINSVAWFWALFIEVFSNEIFTC